MTSDETTVTRPWDDATVAQFRSDHVTNHGWTCAYGGGPDCPIARWIATLDAALRSGSGIATSAAPIHYPHCNDRCIHYLDNSDPAPTSGDADPLREAVLFGPQGVTFPNLPHHPTGPDVLDAIAAYMDGQDDEREVREAGRHSEPWKADRAVQAHLREWSSRLRAALAAPPSPVGLDEWIASALDTKEVADFFGGGFESGEITWLSRWLASRLSSTGGEP